MTTASQIVRSFSPCGPCLTLGKLVNTTAKFYCYQEWRGRDSEGNMVFADTVKKVARDLPGRYSRAHIEACTSCRDHAKTQYPNGYMD